MLKKYIIFSLVFILLWPAYAVAQSSESDLFIVSQKAMEDGFYDVAIRYLDQFLQSYPQSQQRHEAKLLLGQCYFFKSQFLKAFAIFQELSTHPTLSDATSFWLGETYLKTKDYLQAKNFYKKTIDQYPQSTYAPQAAYALAWIELERNQFDKAQEAFQQFLVHFPDHALSEDAQFRIGECAYKAGQYPQSIQSFRSFLKNFPESKMSDQAYFLMAESYYYLQDFAESIKTYRLAIQATRHDRTQILAHIGIGWGHLRLKQWPEAQSAFQEAKRLSEERGVVAEEPLFGLASLYAEQNDYQKALSYYDILITKYPQSLRHAEALLEKAHLLYTMGQYPEALVVYQQIIDSPGNHPQNEMLIQKATLGLAWTYLKSGIPEHAIQTFQRVINSSPNNIFKVSALTQIGDVYQDLGRYADAIESYDLVLKDFPGTPYTDYAQYRQGIAFLKLGKINSAILSFKSLQKNFPESRYLVESHYYLGVAHFNKSEWILAKEHLNRFIRDFPSGHEFLADAHFVLALSQQNLGEHDEAIKTFRAIERLFSQNLAHVQKARLGIARNLYAKGAVAEALKEFKLIAYKYPKTPTAFESLLWLGEYYKKTRDFRNATLFYEQILTDRGSRTEEAEALLALGDIARQSGEHDKALNYFKQITPEHGPSMHTKAKLAIADTFARQLSPENALAAYENIIQNSPEFSRDAHIKIAKIAADANDKPRAIAAYNLALQAKPHDDLKSLDDCQIQFAIADLYELSGQVQQAIEEYLKIPYLYPQDIKWIVKSLLRLARIFESREDWSSAKTCYEKIMEYPVDERTFAQERLERVNRILQQQ